MNYARHLVIMVKAPMAGRVKTRLAEGLGNVRATAFYRNITNQLLRRLAHDPRWQTWLSIAPDNALDAAFWPDDIARMAQGPGGLGVRMQRIFDSLPPGPAVIVGSDIPDIGAHHIAGAFKALGSVDAVFGPAKDGGYWLVGQRRTPKTLPMFDDIRWSSPHALSDTLKNLKSRKVGFVEILSDIDTASDYYHLRRL